MAIRRWLCPKCSSGKNAPERMRKDDVRRFCLACSEKTGRLVERTCAVLDTRRQKAAARHAERQRKVAQKGRDKWRVEGVHVLKLAKQCWKALFFGRGDGWMGWIPQIYLKRSKRPSRGWAYRHGTVQLYAGSDCDAAKIRELVLHEMTHHAVGLDHSHDTRFNGALADAAHKLWGYPGGGGEGYSGSRALEQWLREQLEAGVELKP